MNAQNEEMHDSKQDRIECPECGELAVQSRIVPEKFTYGSGERAVELEALIPYRRCANCGFEYTDGAAEDVMHEAICLHLKRMPPSAVASVRKKYSLKRDEFAAKTQIGEASIARWESGQLVQNAAYDNFLYLLTYPENMVRLEQRWSESSQATPVAAAAQHLSKAETEPIELGTNTENVPMRVGVDKDHQRDPVPQVEGAIEAVAEEKVVSIASVRGFKLRDLHQACREARGFRIAGRPRVRRRREGPCT